MSNTNSRGINCCFPQRSSFNQSAPPVPVTLPATLSATVPATFFPPPPLPPPFPPLPPNIDVRLSSATGSAGPLPLIHTVLSDPINVVSVTIDTRGMRRSVNLLLFTSQINLPLGISVSLNFEIFRSINDGVPMKVGSSYVFSTIATALESEAFSFQFADENLPEGVYTYSVQISTNSILDITPGLTVNNGILSVLAVRR